MLHQPRLRDPGNKSRVPQKSRIQMKKREEEAKTRIRILWKVFSKIKKIGSGKSRNADSASGRFDQTDLKLFLYCQYHEDVGTRA
jgi:hypothetical protein